VDNAGGGRLAVGACQVDDPEGALRVTQQVQHRAYPLQGRIDLGLRGAGQDLRAHLRVALTGARGAQNFSKVWMYTRATVRAFTWTTGPGEGFGDARTRTILVPCRT